MTEPTPSPSKKAPRGERGSPGEFPRLAVVTIQGGGVFGLSLLGQLHALEERGIRPLALAGTSAGAIVATLYWAGLSAKTVRDRFCQLAEQGGGLVDLLGPYGLGAGGLSDFQAFRRFAGRVGSYLAFLQGRFDTRPGGVQRRRWRELLGLAWNVPLFLLCDGLQFGQDLGQMRTHFGRRGLFPGSAFETIIDRLIRESPLLEDPTGTLPAPPDRPGGRLLTFADIRGVADRPGRFFPPLFLTATNLTTRRLELFDSLNPRYDGLPIARAVRASAAFPFFFQPVDIEFPDGDFSYVDGGVIANYPAFVFSNEFRQWLASTPGSWSFAMRPWMHIGLRLRVGERPRLARELEDPRAFLEAMLSLLNGGARTDLEDRLAQFVPRSLSIDQPYADAHGPRNVLEVDRIDARAITVMYERGRAFAAAQMDRRSFALPDSSAVEPHLQQLLERARIVLAPPAGPRCVLRSNLIVAQGNDLALLYRANMDDRERDRDRELRFGFRDGLSGFCFVRRRPLLCNLQRFGQLFADNQKLDPAKLFGFTPEIQKQVRQDRTWLLSVPIFDPEASYPRELLKNPDIGVEGQHYVELDSPTDGAVFGVLNLDADLDYGKLKLPEEPQEQKKDVRIALALGIMQTAAVVLGKVFSQAFARRRGPSNG